MSVIEECVQVESTHWHSNEPEPSLIAYGFSQLVNFADRVVTLFLLPLNVAIPESSLPSEPKLSVASLFEPS